MFRAALISCAAAFLASTVAAAETSPTFKVLYTFERVGGTPTAIIEVSPGNFMGVIETSPGVFSISSEGKFGNIYYFPTNTSGLDVLGLTPALNSQTYGAASNLGPAVTFSEIFSLNAGGSVAAYPFNGATQGGAGKLVASPDGRLYSFFGKAGATPVFTRVTYQGSEVPLYSLSAAQGLPYSLFLSVDGNFYGISLMNNTTEAGIFRLTAGGSFSWVAPSFPTGKYGVYYNIGVMQAGNGKFYGTLPQGGTSNAGSIYEATQDGKIQTIHEFSQLNLGIPESLLEASDGMLYGTARGQYNSGFNGYSSIFRLNPYTGEFATIFNFVNQAQGECECYLTQGTDGKLYGVSSNAGTYGLGTVFVLDAGLPPPKPLVSLLSPQSGSPGQQILLWGRGLLGATSAAVNGIAASFKVASNQGIWVNVPAGATTGPVSVTTPNGSYVTIQSFTVN
jgi:hypothetical protein